VVRIRGPCHASKGRRRPYESGTLQSGLTFAKYEVPRLTEGKHLQLLHRLLGDAGPLDADEATVRSRG